MNPRQIRSYCTGCVGKRIAVRHSNGTMYHGILHSVTDQGIILRPLGGTQPVSGKSTPTMEVEHALAVPEKDDATQVWFGAWFLIAFALIAGLWAWGAGGWGGYGGYGGVGPGYGPGYGVPGVGIRRPGWNW